MAQYARPNSTIAAGLWTAVGAATHHECLDEVIANDDTDYIRRFGTAISDCKVGLSSVSDPQVHTGHIVRVRMEIEAGSGHRVTVSLYQGVTLIQQIGYVAFPASWTTTELTVTEAFAANITDYSDLAILFRSDNFTTGDKGKITWVELEVPEAIVSPTATTDPATSVGTETATPNGTLDDDGGEACDCGFEYGLDTGYGTTTPTQSKETGGTFSQALTGLSPNTTYHFRAIATNTAGTSYGSDATFTTEVDMATVTTDPATSVEATKATPNGTLDDDGGEACEVRFQYGETTGYGTNTDWQTGKTTGDTFEQALVGLLPGRVYHFRAQAKNSAGTASGADRVFHTAALSAEAFKALKKSYPLGRAEL